MHATCRGVVLLSFAIQFSAQPIFGSQKALPSPDPLEVQSDKVADVPQRVQFDYTLGAYYTSSDVIFNWSGKPIPDVGEMSETKVYRDLWFSSFLPQSAILEASVYPMPLGGVLVRDQDYNLYQSAQVGGEGFNLIRAATNGYQEPYAFSLFLGNVMRYKPPMRTAEEREKNKQSGYQSSLGFIGYVISYGAHQIKDNIMFQDHWVELEWKIKGDQLFTLQKLQWSYKFGVKLHDNHNVSDVFFVGMKRDRLDYTSSAWDFLMNSGFEARVDFLTTSAKPARVYLEVNKKWPVKQALAFSLVLGFLWQSQSLYTGPLDNYPGGENYQVILRPNIEF
ncbi:MAG: hypothetical protein JSR44_07720 [Spirochaetes bacterium]|nr:hypothetical protein [Spirochaetota bacterium]